jgi:hypothetical protein
MRTLKPPVIQSVLPLSIIPYKTTEVYIYR